MPGQIRPIKKMADIVYNILKIPDSQRQRNERRPTDRRLYQWSRNSPYSQ